MKNKLAIAALCLAVIVLLLFILHDPKQTDSHKDDYARVINERDSFKVHESAGLKKIDSLEFASKSKDSAIAALKTEQATTRKALDKTTATASRLAGEVKELRKGDASEFASKCDSLAEQAQNFAYLYGQYKDYSDSLSVQVEQQKIDYATAFNEQKKLYAELKTKNDGLMQAYTDLFKDYTSAKKTVKRERLKTKIAALLALVAGGAAVLK